MTAQIGFGDKLNQILLTLVIHGKAGQAKQFVSQLLTSNPEINTDDRLHSLAMSITIEAHQTTLVHLVCDGHGWHTKLGSASHQRFDLLQTIHHGEIGVNAQMNETGFSHGFLCRDGDYSRPKARRTGRKLRR